jgi:antitoxin component YwqK of YwqJK toxin-antitoxin module
MKTLHVTIFVFFNLFCLGQSWLQLDTFKIAVTDTSFIMPVIVISNDTVETYEIKPIIRKDGVYQVFSDKLFSRIIHQTTFIKNNKVSQDIYWYPNGNTHLQFETIEVVCSDSVNNMDVYFTRCPQKIGKYMKWYSNGKTKETGSYMLIDRCSSRKSGDWEYWDKKAKKTFITYK